MMTARPSKTGVIRLVSGGQPCSRRTAAMKPTRPAPVRTPRKTTRRRRSIRSRWVRMRASAMKRASHLDETSMGSQPGGITKERCPVLQERRSEKRETGREGWEREGKGKEKRGKEREREGKGRC